MIHLFERHGEARKAVLPRFLAALLALALRLRLSTREVNQEKREMPGEVYIGWMTRYLLPESSVEVGD